jgi:hypothetical protein
VNYREFGRTGWRASTVSERLLAQLKRERSEEIIIAGRRLDPHLAEGYTIENLTAFSQPSGQTAVTLLHQ